MTEHEAVANAEGPVGTHRFEPVPLDFKKMNGLAPFVLQHALTRQILMLGFLNEEAWRKSCETGILWLYRRTLGRVWSQGEVHGRHIRITRVIVDCDDDSVLFETIPETPICGHGYLSCFTHELPAVNFAHDRPR